MTIPCENGDEIINLIKNGNFLNLFVFFVPWVKFYTLIDASFLGNENNKQEKIDEEKWLNG